MIEMPRPDRARLCRRDGRLQSVANPRALYLMQMFNHQTHHRAQVTAALHRVGVDYGSTDLWFRPGSPF